jgi:hypothetical protein
MMKENNSSLVGITEITEQYLPMSKRRVRRFVTLYLSPIRIGNRILVKREQLEQLLSGSEARSFPL